VPKTALTAKMTSAKTDEYGTPAPLVRELRREFDLVLDLAARQWNKKCPAYLGPDHPCPEMRDSLLVDWARLLRSMGRHAVGFLNPPFSLLDQFMEKCWHERQRGAVIVCVLPHKTETVWYHELGPYADEIRELRRRQSYDKFSDEFGTPLRKEDGSINDDPALFASNVTIWNGRAPELVGGPRRTWWDLGLPPKRQQPRLVRTAADGVLA
jgi:phage N-6-adenine-methyltransferase